MTPKLKTEADIRFKEKYKRIYVSVNADEYETARGLGLNFSKIGRDAVLREIERIQSEGESQKW